MQWIALVAWGWMGMWGPNTPPPADSNQLGYVNVGVEPIVLAKLPQVQVSFRGQSHLSPLPTRPGWMTIDQWKQQVLEIAIPEGGILLGFRVPLHNPDTTYQQFQISTPNCDSTLCIWRPETGYGSQSSKMSYPPESYASTTAGVIGLAPDARGYLEIWIWQHGDIKHEDLNLAVPVIAPFSPDRVTHNLQRIGWSGIFAGAFMAMWVFSLLLSVIVQERFYWHYLAWTTCVLILGTLGFNRVGIALLPEFRAEINQLGAIILIVVPLAYLSFIRSFLPLQILKPSWLRVAKLLFRVLVIWALLLLIRYFVMDWELPPTWRQLLTVVEASYFLVGYVGVITFGCIAAALVARRGFRLGWVALAANAALPVVFLVSILISIMGGPLDSNTRIVLLNLALLLEQLLFSSLILFRYVAQRRALNESYAVNARLQQEEQQRLEELVEQRTAEIETASREKDELMGVVAHDLKNPIAAIQLYSRLIAEPAPPDRIQEHNAQIADTADQMLELVSNLLDINQLDQQALQVYLQELDVATVAERVTNQYVHRAADKHIGLQLALTPGLPTAIGDSRRLAQVLDNLVSNAVKFSPPHTTVVVATELQGDEVCIIVRDQGPGLQPEDRARLFQKYARLSARPTGGESSTGLGLNIAQQLVERMDGRLTVASQPGQGATFTIHLPLAEGYFVPIEVMPESSSPEEAH